MDPETFESIVQSRPSLHERPRGGVVIGSVDGQACGCVMYWQPGDQTGVAEFKRMCVSENGRGHGLRRKMLDYMLEQMIADGFQNVSFSSARFLTHAQRMYKLRASGVCRSPQAFQSTYATVSTSWSGL